MKIKDVLIVTGTGTVCKSVRYTGKRSCKAMRARLTREWRRGNQWAYYKVLDADENKWRKLDYRDISWREEISE